MSSTACCSGNTHSGEPKGVTGTLHGLPTYIAEPPNGTKIKGVVVIVPDAFGWEFVNLRLLSDVFAERLGVRCLLPDFMEGRPAHQSALLDMKTATDENASWFNRIVSLVKGLLVLGPFLYRNRFSVRWPLIEPFFRSVREGTDLPIGAIGYCWGGKFAVTLAHGTSTTSDGRLLIDAAFTAHPSNLVIPADIKKVNIPLLISHASKDIVLSDANVKDIQKIFAEKEVTDEGRQAGKFDVKIIEGARHGFAVRGDPKDEDELKYAQMAEDQAVAWFERWLVSKG